MSWKPEVEVNGQFCGNAVVFATKEEAEQSAKDLFNRWTLCTGHRAVESSDAVNYVIKEGVMEPVSNPVFLQEEN